MPKPRSADDPALEGRHRDVILTMATTVMCPITVLHAIHFSGVAVRTRQRMMAVLSQWRLVNRAAVKVRAPHVGRRRALVYLSHEGWQLAGTLGAAVPPLAMRRLAAAVSDAVAEVADAYATALTSGLLDAGALWTVCPPPQQEYAPMPEGVWALLQRDQEVLAFDLDLPGRSLAQVENRLKNWRHFIAAHRQEHQRVAVCYVATTDRRQQEIAGLRSQNGWGWLHLDTPGAVLRSQFLSGTPGDSGPCSGGTG